MLKLAAFADEISPELDVERRKCRGISRARRRIHEQRAAESGTLVVADDARTIGPFVGNRHLLFE
jgi:hypothetical protein